MKLHIHKKSYKHKPQGKMVGIISNEVTEEVVEVTPQELAQIVGEEGHTAVLATMKGKRNKFNMEQQQVLMLDFDNKDDNGKKTRGMFYVSMLEMMADSFIQENASFMYKTFSHTNSHDKFRVAFVLDKPLTSLEEVYGAYDYLLNKYPNADIACKDPSRLFFGGTEYIEIDFNNILESDKLPKAVIEQPKPKAVAKSRVEKAQTAKPTVVEGEKPTWKLMKEGNKEEVAERLSVYGARVHSKVQAVNLLKSINMADILGTKFDPFFDLFHYEKSPSAGIFKMEDSDIYLYKCHSSSHEFTGDIIMVVKRLLDISYMEALNYLMEATGIEVEVTEQIKILREQCDLFINLLVSEDLKETYPAIHNRFWRYKTQIVTLLTIFKENIYEDENGNLKSLTWMSVRTLAKKVYGKETSHNTMTQLLNLLTFTSWIDKLDESQIPTELLKKLKETQNANKREKRSNVFELLTLGDDFFTQLNKQCEEMKENGFTMKGFSREYILRTHGQEMADKIYPQDKNRKISAVSDKITTDIHSIALKMIEEQGIAIEKDLLARIQKKWKSKGFTERKYKQAVSEMLDIYGLERKRLTKDLKEELGLNLPPKSMPTILVKAV